MSKQRSQYRPQPITVALIRKLDKAALPDKPRDIRDRTAGLILRHQTTGYLGLYANLGRGKRERLCDARRIIDPHSKWTLGKARADARRLKVQHTDGRDFAAERKANAAVPTLETFLDDTYEPWLLQNRRHGTTTVKRIKGRFADFLQERLDQITPSRLEPWRAGRQQDRVKPETINRDAADLRRALTRAAKLEIISRNPLLGFEEAMVDRRKQLVRALAATEKRALLAALEARDATKRKQRVSANRWRQDRGYELLPPIGRFADVLTPAVIVSLETGVRRGELLELKWPSIDLEQRMLHVEGSTPDGLRPLSKTYETRSIPLNDLAHKTLRDWWLQRGQPRKGYVFTLGGDERIGSLKTSYHGALEAAGIKRIDARGVRVNWHSLRHTFGTLLGAAGVDPTTLMKLMGHANLSTTQRYLHTDQDRKRAAVDLLAGAK
jgi:integrase